MPYPVTEILENKTYREQHGHLIQRDIPNKLKASKPQTARSWYSFARVLVRTRDLDDAQSKLRENPNLMAHLVLEMLRDQPEAFDGIWKTTGPRLEDYEAGFEAEWAPISDRVLSNLSTLAKAEWGMDEIRVGLVDCLYGGFSWNDCVILAPLPDFQVEKKFLTHELSELITPSSQVARRLLKAGLDPGITHTVVDMIAYFAVKDHLKKPVYPNPERKGIGPNPSYYPAAEQLFPIFDKYAANPSIYPSFEAFLEEMVLGLGGSERLGWSPTQ
jgi:hypothetical protein